MRDVKCCHLFSRAHTTRTDFNTLIVYRKGDIVMDPMNSRDILPKMFQGWGGVGWVMVGWVM